MLDAGIDISGMVAGAGTPSKLKPDKFKAYVEFSLAHAFPVVTSYSTSFHPTTLRNSYETMLHQCFNYGHKVSRYYKGKPEEDREREDRILGSIIAVEFPREPIGGWVLTDSEKAPGMRCVASVAKEAKGIDRIIGQHQTGRHDWTVSLELEYFLVDSGVVLIPDGESKLSDDEKALVAKHTPADYAKAGLGYLPLIEADDSLISCFSREKGTWSKPWKGNRLVTLMNGIDGMIQFKGTGIVQYGAEPAARIEQILAEDKEMAALAEGLEKLNVLLDSLIP